MPTNLFSAVEPSNFKTYFNQAQKINFNVEMFKPRHLYFRFLIFIIRELVAREWMVIVHIAVANLKCKIIIRITYLAIILSINSFMN